MPNDQAIDIETLLTFFTRREWLPLAALVAMYVTRLVGSDTKLPIDIPGNWKPYILLALGGVTAALDKVVSGRPWTEALGSGAALVVLSLVTHNYVIQPTGKDLPLPRALKRAPESPKSVTRITVPPASAAIVFSVLFGSIGLIAVCVAVTSGCTREQEAKALPALDFAQALAHQAHDALEFVAPLLPPGDAQVVAARADEAAGNLGKVFDALMPLLHRAAESGNDIPEQVVADVVVGAQAAKAIEQGMRAVSGRNSDGSAKDGGS